MSCRAYAKRRGVSATAVSLAIGSGRLVKSVARNAQGHVVGIADAALADREWDANTDPQRRVNAAGGVDARAPLPVLVSPPPPVFDGGAQLPSLIGAKPIALTEHNEPESTASSTERLKSAQADLAELKRDQERGDLVLAKDVERRLVDVFSACKSHLLAIPSRARQALPHLSTADVTVIENLVRESLEELV